MNILYGGSEGIDSEICENCKSLGEFLLKKFQEADDNILLVICGIKLNHLCVVIN